MKKTKNNLKPTPAEAHMTKREFLESYGWIVGRRDHRLNTNFPGAFMVVEPHDEAELPTADGSNGPWCVVGDDLDALIDEGYAFLSSLMEVGK